MPTLLMAALWGSAVIAPGLWAAAPWLGIAALAGWGLHRRTWPLVHLGVVALVTMAAAAIPALAALWPVPLLLGLGALVGVDRLAPDSRAAIHRWWRRGRLGQREALMAVGFAAAASLALVAWARLANPDLSDLLERIPPWSPVLLAHLGLLFSTANAFAEEIAFRGVAQHALERAWGPTGGLLLQAALFGLVHFHGFPRGWIGVGLAAVYGLMMGLLRNTSRGLAVPIAAHVLADATIFTLLVALA